jgi:hypothetical protein
MPGLVNIGNEETNKLIFSSDVEAEAEAEAPEAVAFWWKWKRKHLEICRFRFRSVSKLVYKFW